MEIASQLAGEYLMAIKDEELVVTFGAAFGELFSSTGGPLQERIYCYFLVQAATARSAEMH